MPSRAEPACHVGRTSSDAPSQRLGIDLAAGGGDALNTQDDVRRNDAEHDNLSHVSSLSYRIAGLADDLPVRIRARSGRWCFRSAAARHTDDSSPSPYVRNLSEMSV